MKTLKENAEIAQETTDLKKNLDELRDINLRIFDTAKIKDFNNELYQVQYTSTSTQQWITGEDQKQFLPINNLTKSTIDTRISMGHDVYIKKEWSQESSEVLPVHLVFDTRPSLENYMRRGVAFINGFIQGPMANANAAVIYGFNVLNNKFIEAGFVFSEKNKSLKYIDIMDRADELEDEHPDLSEELMNDLEKYIEYRDILDRTYFIWYLKEEVISKLKTLASYQPRGTSEYFAQNSGDSKPVILNESSLTYQMDFKEKTIDLNGFDYSEQLLDTVTESINIPKEILETTLDQNDYHQYLENINKYKENSDEIVYKEILSFYSKIVSLETKIQEFYRMKLIDLVILEFTQKVNALNKEV